MTNRAEDVTGNPVSDAAQRCFVGYNLKRAINALQADLSRVLKPYGLRVIFFSAIALILDNPVLVLERRVATGCG